MPPKATPVLMDPTERKKNEFVEAMIKYNKGQVQFYLTKDPSGPKMT